MPAFAHPTPPPFADNDPVSFATAPLRFDALVKNAAEPAAGEMASSARRAVDSAMAVVDHFAHGSQRGVNLQFSVSGLDVAVRVEMRQDGVHTVFRTDSPELRTALAQEWNTVVSQQPTDRAQRLAEPVFTSTSAGGTSSGDQGASQQREPGTPPNHWEKAASFAGPSPAGAPAETPVPAATQISQPGPHASARHLHTFA